MQKITVESVYKDLHSTRKKLLIKRGATEDQANRKSTIYAVRTAWEMFSAITKKGCRDGR